jgi:hypothetical protein
MCSFLMNMLGTDVCPVISPSAAWMADPSSEVQLVLDRRVAISSATYRLGRVQSCSILRPSRSTEPWSLGSMGSRTC